MVSSIVVALALRQDAFQFKFQPKVGEKYRYSITMADAAGTNMLPEGSKFADVYKIAGEKDGKFTIHQTMELTGPDGKTDSNLISTFRVDSRLGSEILVSSDESKLHQKGQEFAAKLVGIFGVYLPASPVKPGDTWKLPFDGPATAQAFFPPMPPEANAKFEGSGDIGYLLEKMDDKQGFFKSAISITMGLTASDKGQNHHATFACTCDQTCSLDRLTGMPIKIDRKFKMEIKADAGTNTTTLVLHMERIQS